MTVLHETAARHRTAKSAFVPLYGILEGLLTPTRTWRRRTLRLAEDKGNHDQGRPGTPPRIASLWLRTMEKGLGEILK